MPAKSHKFLKDYFFAMLKGFLAEAEALGGMEHPAVKGHLREIFIQNLLRRFLPSYLSIGTGVIINNQPEQSRETDIIVYDNRVLPPFLGSENLDVFPIEGVVSAIEIKSFLDLPKLRKADRDATHLIRKVFENNNWLDWKKGNNPPICAVLGLSGSRIRGLSQNDDRWINNNISSLKFICSVGKFSWIRRAKQGGTWVYDESDDQLQEVRRFLSVLVDNLRTVANQNWMTRAITHSDWLGQYLRYI